MSTSRYLKKCLTLGLCTLVFAIFCSHANGEDWGGPDKVTCKRPDGTTEPVQIGKKPIKDWCYSWTPPDGLSDPHIANPMASPATTTDYVLTVVSDNFLIVLDYPVKVTVGTLNSFTITTSRCCFKANEKLSVEMFTITTDPPGYEQLVTFSPPDAPNSMVSSQYTSVITAKAKCGPAGASLEQTVSIPVVNDNVVLQVSVGVPNLPKCNFAETEKKMKDAMDKAKLITDGVKVPGNPCEFKFSHQLEASIAYADMCCPDKSPCLDTRYKIALSYKPCFGGKCDVPFYGVPYISTLNGRFTVNACLNIGFDYKTRCDDNQVCFNGSGEFSLGLGVSWTVLGGAGLDASLMGVAKATSPTFQVCYPANTTLFTGQWCGQVDVVGDVTMLGVVKYKVQRTVIAKRCL